MNLTSTTTLIGSEIIIPSDVISVSPCDNTQIVPIIVIIKRSIFNGMTLKEYADAVIKGTHPIVNRDDFTDMFSLNYSDLQLITDFANLSELTIINVDKVASHVQMTGTVSQLNRAFNIELINVTTSDRTYMSYNGSVSIPKELSDIILCIFGLSDHILIKRI
jgi:kumamolisin